MSNNKSQTTLVSIIGIGQIVKAPSGKDTTPGYDTVDYTMEGNNQHIVTSCSTNAIISSGLYSFDHVVIIGTRTSAWGELLDKNLPEEEDTFYNLLYDYDKKNPFDADSDTGKQLCALLAKRWNTDVQLIVHDQNLDSAHSQEIFNCYIDTFLKAEQKVILDATHGFRWMPLFMISALQFKEAFGKLVQLNILYAEMQNKTQGIIRQLDTLWEGHNLASGIAMFNDKFEMESLEEPLKEICPALAAALVNVCNCLKSNYLVPMVWDREQPDRRVGKPFTQLKNAIQKDFRKLENPPYWSQMVVKIADRWYQDLSKLSWPSERLLVIGDMYWERGFYCQATQALDVAMGIFACERQMPDQYPEWKDLKEKRDNLFDAIHQDRAYQQFLDSKTRFEIHSLANNRNMVAHGALNSANNRNSTPTVPNVAGQYRSQRNALQKLFSLK